VVSVNEKVWGVIELQDIIKTGIQERFQRLRKMGVKTVMVTGDNPLTAKFIAEKPEWTILSPKQNRKIR
jgi:K+-transporting ATPase ATPase B chain